MHHTIAAVYEDRNKARRAMDDLNAEGFSPEDIYLTQMDESGEQHQVDEGESGFVSFFKNLFGYDDHQGDAELYSEAVRRGNYVLTVDVPDDSLVDRVSSLLEKNDPIDIDLHAEQWKSGGWAAPESMRMDHTPAETDALGIRRADSTGSDYLGDDVARLQEEQADAGDRSLDYAGRQDNAMDRPLGSTSADYLDDSAARMQESQAAAGMGYRNQGIDRPPSSMQEEKAIPIVEEELHVGKRQVQRGGVRVYQRVVEQPVNESIQLREEHVDVERRPVDKPASAADLSNLQEESFEVRASAEEPVVEKSARVVEEVVIGKTATEREQNISDSVRHTEVEVEELSGQSSTARSGLDGSRFDQTVYRPHWDSNYASSGGRYEDFEPAYRYGSLLNTNDRYKGRSWDEIETSARDEWEAGNPGTWEKVKAAVRHGWDKAMH